MRARPIGILIAAGLGILATVALGTIEDVPFMSVLVLVAVTITVITFGLLWKRSQRLPWLCDPLFLALVFLSQFYVLGAIAHEFLGMGELPFMRPVPSWRAVQASSAFLIVVVTLLAGYHAPWGRLLGGLLPDFSSSRTKLAAVWAEGIIVGGSVLGCLGWIEYQGGLIAKLGQGYTGGKEGGALFGIAHMALVVGTLLIGWRMFSKPLIRTRDSFLLAVLLVFDAIFFGIIYGVRKYLFFLYFGLVAIWVLRRGWASLPKLRVAAALLALLVFFGIWGAIRSRPVEEIVSGATDPRVVRQSSDPLQYVSGLSEPFGVACLVWDLFPQVEPYRHGSTLLVTLFGFIPRAVWPAKPIGIGKEITRYIVGPFYEDAQGFSVTVTLPADFYLNFGWLGVVFGGFALGILCRAVTEYASRGMVDGLQTNAARVLIPAVFVVGLAEVRSDMATMLSTYVLAFIPLLFALTFFRIGGGIPARSDTISALARRPEQPVA